MCGTEDISHKLGEILNDEESMKQIQELAEMLMGHSPLPNEAPSAPEAESFDPDYSQQKSSQQMPMPDLSALMGMLTGAGSAPESGGKDNSSGGIDMGMIMQLMQLIGSSGTDDKNTALLIALRPHISEDKQQRLDKALKMMKLYNIFISLKNSGMLGDLNKLL